MPAKKVGAVSKAADEKISAGAPKGKPQVSFGENYRTSQIYSKGFEFAFMTPVKKVYTQACTFVYCKDFLHDAVWAFINKKPWEIYGFKYTPGKDLDLDMRNCSLAFRNTAYKAKPATFHEKLKACQGFLNGIEKKMKLKRTKIFQVEHDGAPCWLIVGDKRWQHAPPLLGLYTLFIRVGFMHDPKDTYAQTLEKAMNDEIEIGDNSSYAGNNDCEYLQEARRGVELMLEYGTEIFYPEIERNYPVEIGKLGLHDNFGPVNFTNNAKKGEGSAIKKAVPHWYRAEVWGKIKDTADEA